jgi:hypothetical protein
MPNDLTAILLPLPPRGPEPNDILNLVAQHAGPAVWVRLYPLTPMGLHQLEVLEGPSGLPSVAPSLVSALSENDGKALFVHVNHEAQQAILHAFEDGAEVDSYIGGPGEEFAGKMNHLVGYSVDELVAADDGTRVGFGQTASRSAALVRGRLLIVPPGTPTGLGSFAFHDTGHDRPGAEEPDEDEAEEENGEPAQAAAPEDEDEDEELDEEDTGIRVAFFAYDHELIAHAWNEMPGEQLAQVLATAPPDVLGPLYGLREEIAEILGRLRTPPGKELLHPIAHTRAFEMLALSHAGAYAGGDAARYLSERVLPLLCAISTPPVIDKDEVEDLMELDSVLTMMAEVLPCPKPPGGYGPIVEALGNSELGALVPWARESEEYEGVVFRVHPERLLKLCRDLDMHQLGTYLDRFCRVLYEAHTGKAPARPPEDGAPAALTEEYVAWRRTIEQRSATDLNRFLTAWAELRLVLEMAALNSLAVGMIVYAA